MAAMTYYVGDLTYAEIEQNHDPIYDALISGAPVWISCNYNNVSNVPTNVHVGLDGYCRFMVTQWYLGSGGLTIVCPDNSLLVFPNGSYTPSK